LRFWNNDVLQNIDGVLQVIAEKLEKAPLTRRAAAGEGALLPAPQAERRR
jgi:hypothetical protein